MADEHEPPTSPPDAYERQYMHGDRAVLRARQRQPRWVPATALAVMLLALAASWPSLAWMWAHRGAPGVTVMLLALGSWFAINNVALLLALLTDHITRMVLTPSHLHVHRGLWTDEIALESISAVSVESSRWWRPKHTLRGALLRRERSYLTPGVERALCLEWRDAKGRAKKTWIQFEAAGAFASRIEALTAKTTGVRVSQMPSARADDEAGARPSYAEQLRSEVLRATRGGE